MHEGIIAVSFMVTSIYDSEVNQAIAIWSPKFWDTNSIRNDVPV